MICPFGLFGSTPFTTELTSHHEHPSCAAANTAPQDFATVAGFLGSCEHCFTEPLGDLSADKIPTSSAPVGTFAYTPLLETNPAGGQFAAGEGVMTTRLRGLYFR